MPYAHFLISAEGGEGEERLNRFLGQHAILKVERHFLPRDGEPCWAYCVHFEAGGALKSTTTPSVSRGEQIDYKNKLRPEDFTLYLQLKDWRKERSEREGTVPFALFTNAQLAEIAEQRPTALTALRSIPGVGEGRTEKYGQEVLDVVARAKKGDGEGGEGTRRNESMK